MREVSIVTLCSLTQGNSESYGGYRTYKQMHLWCNSEAEDAQHLLHTKPLSKDQLNSKGWAGNHTKQNYGLEKFFQETYVFLTHSFINTVSNSWAENLLSSYTGRTLNYLKHTLVQPWTEFNPNYKAAWLS